MAALNEVVGVSSQLAAKLALLSNGWIVAEPETAEVFDLVARDPVNEEWYTFQVKTIRRREDRNGEYVIYARRSNGDPYRKCDANYLIGVLGAEGNELPRVYMLENRGCGEYWATEETAETRWIRLPIELDRTIYEGTVAGATVACPE